MSSCPSPCWVSDIKRSRISYSYIFLLGHFCHETRWGFCVNSFNWSEMNIGGGNWSIFVSFGLFYLDAELQVKCVPLNMHTTLLYFVLLFLLNYEFLSYSRNLFSHIHQVCFISPGHFSPVVYLATHNLRGSLLLTWFNFNPGMDK